MVLEEAKQDIPNELRTLVNNSFGRMRQSKQTPNNNEYIQQSRSPRKLSKTPLKNLNIQRKRSESYGNRKRLHSPINSRKSNSPHKRSRSTKKRRSPSRHMRDSWRRSSSNPNKRGRRRSSSRHNRGKRRTSSRPNKDGRRRSYSRPIKRGRRRLSSRRAKNVRRRSSSRPIKGGRYRSRSQEIKGGRRRSSSRRNIRRKRRSGSKTYKDKKWHSLSRSPPSRRRHRVTTTSSISSTSRSSSNVSTESKSAKQNKESIKPDIDLVKDNKEVLINKMVPNFKEKSKSFKQGNIILTKDCEEIIDEFSITALKKSKDENKSIWHNNFSEEVGAICIEKPGHEVDMDIDYYPHMFEEPKIEDCSDEKIASDCFCDEIVNITLVLPELSTESKNLVNQPLIKEERNNVQDEIVKDKKVNITKIRQRVSRFNKVEDNNHNLVYNAKVSTNEGILDLDDLDKQLNEDVNLFSESQPVSDKKAFRESCTIEIGKISSFANDNTFTKRRHPLFENISFIESYKDLKTIPIPDDSHIEKSIVTESKESCSSPIKDIKSELYNSESCETNLSISDTKKNDKSYINTSSEKEEKRGNKSSYRDNCSISKKNDKTFSKYDSNISKTDHKTSLRSEPTKHDRQSSRNESKRNDKHSSRNESKKDEKLLSKTESKRDDQSFSRNDSNIFKKDDKSFINKDNKTSIRNVSDVSINKMMFDLNYESKDHESSQDNETKLDSKSVMIDNTVAEINATFSVENFHLSEIPIPLSHNVQIIPDNEIECLQKKENTLHIVEEDYAKPTYVKTFDSEEIIKSKEDESYLNESFTVEIKTLNIVENCSDEKLFDTSKENEYTISIEKEDKNTKILNKSIEFKENMPRDDKASKEVKTSKKDKECKEEKVSKEEMLGLGLQTDHRTSKENKIIKGRKTSSEDKISRDKLSKDNSSKADKLSKEEKIYKDKTSKEDKITKDKISSEDKISRDKASKEKKIYKDKTSKEEKISKDKESKNKIRKEDRMSREEKIKTSKDDILSKYTTVTDHKTSKEEKITKDNILSDGKILKDNSLIEDKASKGKKISKDKVTRDHKTAKEDEIKDRKTSQEKVERSREYKKNDRKILKEYKNEKYHPSVDEVKESMNTNVMISKESEKEIKKKYSILFKEENGVTDIIVQSTSKNDLFSSSEEVEEMVKLQNEEIYDNQNEIKEDFTIRQDNDVIESKVLLLSSQCHDASSKDVSEASTKDDSVTVPKVFTETDSELNEGEIVSSPEKQLSQKIYDNTDNAIEDVKKDDDDRKVSNKLKKRNDRKRKHSSESLESRSKSRKCYRPKRRNSSDKNVTSLSNDVSEDENRRNHKHKKNKKLKKDRKKHKKEKLYKKKSKRKRHSS